AHTDANILILGENGTGKELVARAIHAHSSRKNETFATVDLGSITETLFESELFGHKKGSFTGAAIDKEGLFKVADGGTVFLDEVSEIPLTLQVKLLRAIEQKEITPVGMTDPINVDVRIIAATNQDLRKRVEEGKFREDLFYRLNVVEIYLPSLTERPEDIPVLAQHFLDTYRKQMAKQVKGFSNEAMNALIRYSWKGEVRELENAVERAVIFCDKDFIGVEHLPEHMHQSGSHGYSSASKAGHNLKDAVREFERKFIEQTLMKHEFNKDATAKALGVSLSSLYRKMEELGISNR
ncbi:MAG TPA: sigma-54 dependent transcriptional regulator, partial [Bacteroidota bacterium]|nr:sigma-54 dependent transcriptional regulator [Bacteroidota bacterium]